MSGPSPLAKSVAILSRALVTVLVIAGIPVLPSGAVGAPPEISYVTQLSLPGSTRKSDIWGWTNPNDNREYVFIGEYPSTGANVFIVEVTDPTNPVLIHTLTGVPAFDLKIWKHYLYLCDGNSTGTDSEIWNVSDPTNPTFEGNFPSCHNITIDEHGFMYLSYSTTRIYDLKPNPTAPTFVWSDGVSGGHDCTVVGDRLYDFHGYNGTFIYDISNIYSPQLLGSIAGGSGIAYHHSGWPSATGDFLYINDELGSSTTDDITVWDISVPASPVKKDGFQDANATVHNGFRIGDYYYSSFYVAGFRVFDVSTPSAIGLADEFDTSAFSGNGVYEGCWGVWPFSPSGYIFASDMQNGLYVFSFGALATGASDDVPPNHFALDQNYPNPFNPTTTISYELETEGHVWLRIFDVQGRFIRTLVNASQPAGIQNIRWNGTDDAGRPVASGVYMYRLDAGGRVDTRRMTLLK